MSYWRVIFNNLLFFRRQNLGITFAATLCAVVLTGALTVGDSVRSTLQSLAEKRIGKADIAMLSPDGFFEESLAFRIQAELKTQTIEVAPIVLTRGTVTKPDGSVKVSNVQVLGVDERFWRLAPNFEYTPMGSLFIEKNLSDWSIDSFFVNERLGKRLKMEKDDRLILRMEEPSMFSRDAPLSGERDNKFVTMNNPLGGILSADGFGNFGLQGNQQEPLTLFVPLLSLQKKLFHTLDEASGSIRFTNFLIMGVPEGGQVNFETANAAMNKSWTLNDAGIEIKDLQNSKQWSVRTRQVFLSENLVKKTKEVTGESAGVLTYLVNAIENKSVLSGKALIPYSMMSGVVAEKVNFLENDWKDNQIALNLWAANDLNASVGDLIRVSYYTVGERRKLIESFREFKLRKILPMPDPVASEKESDWTPRFPGLSDAESCGEWDTGIPIVHKVRDRDEHYWDEFRGTPKGFVSLRASQDMWDNRWGSLTGLRIDKRDASKEALEKLLRNNLKAEDAGLVLRSLRSDAIDSVESPVDFAQLFLGFSFFVIVAALAISGMLFTFSLEQRSQQIGLFQAIGWKAGKIKWVYWGEGLLTAIAGSTFGVFLASFYGKIILDLLNGEWSGAVSGTSFSFDASLKSMLIGGLCSASICFLAMIWSTRKLLKREPRELLVNGSVGAIGGYLVAKQSKLYLWIATICLMLSTGVVWIVDFSSSQASMAFFSAGGLLLVSGLFLFLAILGKGGQGAKTLSQITQLNRRNLSRRVGRSLVTVGSMAAGTFLVVSTGAFRKASDTSSDELQSGTGGFSYWGESASPIYDDLNQKEAIDLFDLNKSLLDFAKVVPMRLREGDDASCLNLNKALRPKIYGVKTCDFDGHFDFAEGNWSSLHESKEGGAVPALVDQNTLQWALKKRIGERLQFIDGEGKAFEIELVGTFRGSMLQGALFIREEDFLNKFKQQGGYRSFMLSGKKSDTRNLAVHLEDRFSQYGMEFRDSKDRLSELQKVENTYLSIFQGLGGLGMLIGTCGLGLVVARNLVERAQEFALLEALGYQLKNIQKNVFIEHAHLASWGILLGSLSAILGIAPALFGSILEPPSIGFLWFFLSLVILAFSWVAIAVFLTLRKSQLHRLENE
jgi:putative ABC transport system permease protein